MNRLSRNLFGLSILSLGSIANADNAPVLSLDESYSLTLPLVDYADTPGLYQNAEIGYSPQDNSWSLLRYTKGLPIREIADVEVIITEDVPVQVLLKVTGTFTSLCPKVGAAALRQTGTTFNVYVYYSPEYVNLPPHIGCAQMLNDFEKVVPVPAYGLNAGEYTYSVNGKFAGTFTLLADNVLE